ncbi:hypothetical protein Taro_018361, partial [Colocasia esculenta]|nr:hypothetical protein [Colocasia esculenta]
TTIGRPCQLRLLSSSSLASSFTHKREHVSSTEIAGAAGGEEERGCSSFLVILLLTCYTMALSRTATIALAVSFFGTLAFVLGVIAENKKPESGTPVPGKGVVICQYPRDPTVLLGSLSVISLLLSFVLGLISVFYPYKGKSVPTDALFRSTTLVVFFTIAVGITVLAEGMMMWATITEGLHHSRNIHHNLDNQCPTAKTGVFGGAAFLALDSALFWLICQMLALNARGDYFDEDTKGEYGQVVTADYEAKGQGPPRNAV